MQAQSKNCFTFSVAPIATLQECTFPSMFKSSGPFNIFVHNIQRAEGVFQTLPYNLCVAVWSF